MHLCTVPTVADVQALLSRNGTNNSVAYGRTEAIHCWVQNIISQVIKWRIAKLSLQTLSSSELVLVDHGGSTASVSRLSWSQCGECGIKNALH